MGNSENVTVLVCEGLLEQKYSTLGGLHNKHFFFLTVLKARKSKIKVLADSGSGESLLPGS